MEHAIVILYDGSTPSDYIVERILNELKPVLHAGGEVKVFNSTDIANALVAVGKSIGFSKRIRRPKEELKQDTPADKAVRFLGEIYKNQTGKKFVDAICYDYVIAKHCDEPNKRAFVNAVEILAKDEVSLSLDIIKKYKITPDVLQNFRHIVSWFK